MLQTDNAVLSRLAKNKAVIMCDDYEGTFPAYPNGDRRRRPISWIDADTLNRLKASGSLEAIENGFMTSASYEKRDNGQAMSQTFADQHRDMTEQSLFVPSGVIRSVRVNEMSRPLRRLARQKTADGSAFLSAAEIEAGERFARLYARTGRNQIKTQDYSGSGVGSGYVDRNMTDRMAAEIDARRKMQAACAFMGPGLDTVVLKVCGVGESIDSVERAQKWAKNSGKTVLKLALARLVEYFGTEAGAKTKHG